MKSFLLAAMLLIFLLTSARAQMGADDQYIAIYGVVQQAETQISAGEPQQALASLKVAQAQLQKFQKLFPDWNPGIINYRLDSVSQKIAALQAQVAATSAVVPPASATNEMSAAEMAKASAQEESLRAELAAARAENQTLQSKLKEALALQPAAIDAGELAKAQEKIRSLMKANDLLEARASLATGKPGGPDTNEISSLRQQLANASGKYSAEHSRAEKLAAENAALQKDLQPAGGQNSTALEALRSENDRLKAQLSALQSAANDATAANDLAAKLKSARAQITSLQSAATVAALEKSALENKVKQLSAEVADLRATDDAGRIRTLTEQRDDLAKQLASARKNPPRKSAEAQLAALNQELQSLRARLAVDEAKPVPYTPDELALFRQTTPPPNPEPIKRSIHELPSGTAELVASAQQHFSRHEYDQAEADYRKILDRDQNNGLALANLATIELQQGKLEEAEKHIRAALAQSPDDAYNLATLGEVEFRQEKYDAALDSLSQAAKIDPNNPEIQNYLGVTLSHKGLRVQAEMALRKAIELNPLYAPAHNNLAVVYLNQTPPAPLLARWHYQKAIAAGQPRNPDLEKQLADKGAPVD
jgi:tetratricopeptide (TPR) repeat protein